MKTISIALASVIAVSFAGGCGSREAAADATEDAQVFSVTGVLVYSNAQPGDRIPVVVRNIDDRTEGKKVFTDTDGKFVAGGLAPGRYRMFAIRVYFDVGKGLCEVLPSRDITVSDEDVDLGTLQLEAKTILPVTE